MLSLKAKPVSGVVKWFDRKKRFGFVTTDIGTARVDVFVDNEAAGEFAAKLQPDIEVSLTFFGEWHNRQLRYTAKKIVAITPPPPPVEILTTVKFFNEEKSYGFVHNGETSDVFFHSSVCHKAGFKPTVDMAGMPVKVLVEKRDNKFAVTSFEWGRDVEAEYNQLHPQLEAALVDSNGHDNENEPAAEDEVVVDSAIIEAIERSRGKGPLADAFRECRDATVRHTGGDGKQFIDLTRGSEAA
ncbi:MAG: cold shock domain-containing protein [Patescibacteria group bacterium]